MYPTNIKKDKLSSNLLKMRKESNEQVYYSVLDGIRTYLNTVKTFGFNNPLTKESLKSLKDIIRIKKVENRIIAYLLDNIDTMDVESATKVFADLDSLNARTVHSYEEHFKTINQKCAAKDKSKTNPSTEIDSLITNPYYASQVVGLTESPGTIKKFLNYEDEFWKFISTYLKIVPVDGKNAPSVCGVIPILDDDKNLYNFYTIVPKVVDIDTASVAIEVFKKAHELYYSIGNKYNDIKVEGSALEKRAYHDSMTIKAERTFR